MGLEQRPDVRFLSELYAHDAPQAVLLAEYPSSNSDDTTLQNRSRFLIHDPYPPPRRELLKVLGPHHLMCAWGRQLRVSSEIPPPAPLLAHWERIFGRDGCPEWQPLDVPADYITLFPHESIPAERQVVDPNTSYSIHSKEIIGRIGCPQPRVLERVSPPCVAKLSHGYAGLGNFFIRTAADEAEMSRRLKQEWPMASLVVTSMIEQITGDFGVQFYVNRDGKMAWLGLTQQQFDKNRRWCGGTFSADLQTQLDKDLHEIVEQVGEYIHSAGYFGLVGVDIVRDGSGQHLLVDVNPRLTGITPFLFASRLFVEEGLVEGIYRASNRFDGSLTELIATADSTSDAKVVVLSAFEDADQRMTTCHLSVSSSSQADCLRVFEGIVAR